MLINLTYSRTLFVLELQQDSTRPYRTIYVFWSWEAYAICAKYWTAL